MTFPLRSQTLICLIFLSLSCFADERPNIVLIVADDVGFSDIGVFGSEIRTPNIDALARAGVQLTNFHAAPTCGPSRSMMLTGVDNHLAGAGVNAAGLTRLPQLRGRPGYEGYLNQRVVTFPALLPESGYSTVMTGKWDPGNRPGRLPVDHGFDRSFVLASGGASHFNDMAGPMRPEPIAPYYENGDRVEVLPDGFFSSEFYTSRLIDYIDGADDDKPFLAYLSFTAAHWPLQVPNDWLDHYGEIYEQGWHSIRAARFERLKDLGVLPSHAVLPERNHAVAEWDKLMPAQYKVELRRMQLYAAMIENMDMHIGRLVEALHARDSERETVILFLSDNGAEGNAIDRVVDNDYWIASEFDNRLANLGRQGSFVWLGVGWGQAAASPFRLYKSYTSAGGLRTPALAYSTQQQFQSGMKHEIVTVRDIAATILDLADVEHPGDKFDGRPVLPMTGKSFVPYLTGSAETVHGHDPLGWETYGSRALIKGEWKALMIFPPEGPGEWQLFNLKTDPTESSNLAVDFPDVLQELIDDWNTYAEENGVAVFERDLGYGRYPVTRP